MLVDTLTKWAIECSQVYQIAHIVFVADNAFTLDTLNKSTCLASAIYSGVGQQEGGRLGGRQEDGRMEGVSIRTAITSFL